jgi:acyl dehydratase
MTTALKVGDEIPILTKSAYAPIDEDARNPIHTDDYAREHGLRGALVPGSTLLSYVLEMVYNFFGENWMHHGKINVSFIGGGAINGDALTAHGSVKSIDKDGLGMRAKLDVWMVNQKGEKVVVGEASCIQ